MKTGEDKHVKDKTFNVIFPIDEIEASSSLIN